MKKTVLILAIICFAFLGFHQLVAHAQDAGMAAASAVGKGGIIVGGSVAPSGVIIGSNGIGTSPSDPSDTSFWAALAKAALSKDWILLTGFLLTLLQYALRADWSPVTKWVPWFVDTTVGGWVFNFLVSAAGALGLSAMKHEWSWAIVLQILMLIASSTAAHHVIKDAKGAKQQE